MEDKPSRKRPFLEDLESNKQPMQKRVRFPKGKKVKPGDEAVDKSRVFVDDEESELKDPRLAAKERAIRRNQLTSELISEESRGIVNDISVAEVTYKDSENFVDDGIHIEPFNLDKEREEGYFDDQGNFVEYVNVNEIKDAWLDSLEIDQRFAGTAVTNSKNVNNTDEVIEDLSSEEIGGIKRRIANVLQPGETVTQALRRLKGMSKNKKEKMSAETKRVFDQLTEDAMKLMEENGEYDVYNEKQETFQREAEGYERLAQSKGKGISVDGNLDSSGENYLSSSVTGPGSTSSLLLDSAVGNSSANLTTMGVPSNADDAYDMFGDDDENAPTRASADELNPGGSLQNDYVYDESSGYYYSSSLGYYYDPTTGLYCSAASGQWYSFNEETGAYQEVKEDASGVS